MAKNKSPKTEDGGPQGLMQSLFERMEATEDAQSLNDNVIIPFMAALENVCDARGYVLNIHGEKSNLVYTGEDADAAAIYQLVEDYLAAQGD